MVSSRPLASSAKKSLWGRAERGFGPILFGFFGALSRVFGKAPPSIACLGSRQPAIHRR
jgi:hypothetical protein